MSATECLHVIPSLDPTLMPYFKYDYVRSYCAHHQVSQSARTHPLQFAVHRSALRPTVRSEGLPVTSDDPVISKILQTDRRPVVIATKNECRFILYFNADVGYKNIVSSAIEGMFSARSCLPGHEGPEGE